MQIVGYLADDKEVIVIYTNGAEQVILTCSDYKDACDIARHYNEALAHDHDQ